MYNRITLIGTLIDHPQGGVDPDGNPATLLSLKVPHLLIPHQRIGDSSTICARQIGQLGRIPFWSFAESMCWSRGVSNHCTKGISFVSRAVSC